jgi:FkbH-like protein
MYTYLELLKANQEYKKETYAHQVQLLILNNITTNALQSYVEFQGYKNGIQTNCQFGDYDSIVANAQQLETNNKIVVLFWELANSVHGLEYKIESFSNEQLLELEQKIQQELQLTFTALNKAPLVMMNLFSAMAFSYLSTKTTALEQLAYRLNTFAQEQAPQNVKWIDINKCIAHNGIHQTIDFKGYLKNKVLYKHAFYWEYAKLIQPYLNASVGKIKKLIAFDCDNTLWQGVLGEDGPQGIQMSENTYAGQPFAAAQYRALALSKSGVLVALASKNNLEDVTTVFNTHEAIRLGLDATVALKVNWNPKVQNLQDLAQELNIGADSFVFVDDSNFEVQHMRDYLPVVTTVQVPANSIGYYLQQMEWPNYFVQLNETEEDAKKLVQYKELANRSDEQSKFVDFEAFLSSLNLRLTIYKDDAYLISRMAQLTQKTNQFNLTTKRYTEQQIKDFVEHKDYSCYSFRVEDKFGDSGITGLCIVKFIDLQEAEIDTLLMSCRVLGRNIEFQFIQSLLVDVFKRTPAVKASYKRTAKNCQVSHFYDKSKFKLVSKNTDYSEYRLEKFNFEMVNHFSYITVNYKN